MAIDMLPPSNLFGTAGLCSIDRGCLKVINENFILAQPREWFPNNCLHDRSCWQNLVPQDRNQCFLITCFDTSLMYDL